MRKVKLLSGKWIVFEEDEKLWITHFCSGKAGVTTYKEHKPFFHKAIDLEKNKECAACKEEIPHNLQMMVQLNNAPL